MEIVGPNWSQGGWYVVAGTSGSAIKSYRGVPVGTGGSMLQDFLTKCELRESAPGENRHMWCTD